MQEEEKDNKPIENIPHVDSLYKKWFLEYASYVVLERAIPALYDGLKPVQRRILHAMKEQDDGRFTKVANLIGQTMQYHPHGDASIGDALVNIGQKELLIETQGNWGDIRTGDNAAAPRYIEARLSKFALYACFHDQNTEWQLSYDGRKREPVFLPIKFPLLLSDGVEGIAVGMSTKILPHNFIELCKASIRCIQGKSFELYPDFLQGGMIDVSNYNQGNRGGKIRCRARIEKVDNKIIRITSVPFGVTTEKMIDSILSENQKGRIEIKKVSDNTASDVDIQIELVPGTSIDHTIDTLYAFTLCEVSISPLGCCIIDNKPMFLGVDEMLRLSTKNTMHLIQRELEIKKHDLEEKWHFLSLEKIFFEEQIYKELEKKHETWEKVLQAIEKGFEPYLGIFKREVSKEDYEKLTEKPVRRIYKLDIDDLKAKIQKYEDDIAQVQHHLDHLEDYAIAYFNTLIEKFGKGKERRTEIKTFDKIEVKQVVLNNQKLYANFKDGFIGYGLKKEEFIADCTDLDDIIVIRKDGKMIVSRISDKKFVGKDILYCGVWKKDDERTIYNLIYLDPKSGKNYVKRFQVLAITRDKEYDLTNGNNCKILYLTVNHNGEAEIVNVKLSQSSKARIKIFDFDFKSVMVKGRNSQGNIITTYPIQKIDMKKKGESTIGGNHLWVNKETGRINKNKEGQYLGEFFAEDCFLILNKNGSYSLGTPENMLKVDWDNILSIEKFNEKTTLSAIYFDGDSKNYYVKRFAIELKTELKEHSFITEQDKSKLMLVTGHPNPKVKFKILKGKNKEEVIEEISLNEFIDIKGWKALGNRLTQHELKGKIELLSKDKELIYEEPKKEVPPPMPIPEDKKELDIIMPEEDKNIKPIQGTLFDL